MSIWIGYTTLYREGGSQFARAARTLENNLRSRARTIVCERIESKRDFVNAMARQEFTSDPIEELHFIGHSGMYGPMFRTSKMPEQFSPHEWRHLQIPFAANAKAYFHACRTARWFAPFFARTYGVQAHGFHGYTTVSTQPDRFRWEAFSSHSSPLYVIACAGGKSHGALGSALKHSGFARAEKMKVFNPELPEGDTSYDSVADLYDRTFADIRVRQEELKFIESRIPRGARVLDIGCGNGALLGALSHRIAQGTGVDASLGMIQKARERHVACANLAFDKIDGPSLPYADASFDVVISLLSFRYLDWDPMMNEMRRVLAPGGSILIVDMVTVPARATEWPKVAYDKYRQIRQHQKHPTFAATLRSMVSDPRWLTMLKYNPIRSEHEFRWYLESRFPGRSPKTLTKAYNTRVLGFDSGPLHPGWVPPQSYP